MSVSATDLKSMLSKVRKADTPATPAPAAAPAAVAVAAAARPVPAETESAADSAGRQRVPGAAPEGVLDTASIINEIISDDEMILRILGMLYRAKKMHPNGGAVGIIEMEKSLGIEREGATFVINFMKAKRLIETDDKSRNMITVEGIEYVRNKLTK